MRNRSAERNWDVAAYSAEQTSPPQAMRSGLAELWDSLERSPAESRVEADLAIACGTAS